MTFLSVLVLRISAAGNINLTSSDLNNKDDKLSHTQPGLAKDVSGDPDLPV